MKYFTNCKNLEELRKEYKNLVKANGKHVVLNL